MTESSAKSEGSKAEKLRELSLLLSNGDKQLADEVALSEADPSRYIEFHSENLRYRGVTKPVDGLVWIALVDSLQRRHKLVEIDWKEGPTEFTRAAARMLGTAPDWKKIVDSLDDLNWFGSEKVPEIIRRINQAVSGFGHAVFIIDLASDSYPMSVMRRTVAEKVVKLAASIEEHRVLLF